MAWLTRAIAWTDDNPRLIDGLLAAFFAIGGSIVITVVPIEGSQTESDVLAYLLIVFSAATLLWRRSNPLVALLIAVPLVTSFWIRDYPGGPDAVLWIMFYSAARHGGPNRTMVWRVVGLSLIAILVVATIGVIVPTEDLPLVAVFGIFVIHGTTAAVGEAFYQRAQNLDQLEKRTAALEADLETKAALAAVEERTRIAREMHDIIAHGMSTVVVQSRAAQSILDNDPARARKVLEVIEQTGRESVDDMRRMLGVLRHGDDEAELQPQPDFSDFDKLHEQVSSAGVDVDIAITGQKLPLPPGLELAGYRVVQEALTNVMRHAGRPVRVEAQITYGPEALAIRITDDGLGAAAEPATGGSGLGLMGMQERVEIYNGSFHAGPRPGGGYCVDVSLPIPSRVTT